MSDALFARLTPEAFVHRPVAERHRLIFYLGHLDAFDFNLLWKGAGGRPGLDPDREQLFAFGIDPTDGDLPRDTAADWPPVPEVERWARSLRPLVDEVVSTAPRQGWLEDGWAVHIAVEHRLMHVETLAYLFHRLPVSMMRPRPGVPGPARGTVMAQRWLEVPAGVAVLGLDRAAAPFRGWDNEYQRHPVEVPAFSIQERKVTNLEWHAFMEAGGYDTPALWADEDWRWIRDAGVRHPAFWVPTADGHFAIRALDRELPFAPHAPVYVSHAEASAYARWQGARLPTEAEWHRAAYGTPDGTERAHPWGAEPPRPGHHGNFGLVHDATTPVGAHPAGRSAFGLDEPVGNGWEWTSTPFGPYPGFEPLPFYPGYSRNFFDGRHFVLRGASPHTHPTFIRHSFRNWFQPHYPYVTATLRLARSTTGA